MWKALTDMGYDVTAVISMAESEIFPDGLRRLYGLSRCAWSAILHTAHRRPHRLRFGRAVRLARKPHVRSVVRSAGIT
jgi:hypothetical protein